MQRGRRPWSLIDGDSVMTTAGDDYYRYRGSHPRCGIIAALACDRQRLNSCSHDWDRRKTTYHSYLGLAYM